MTAHPQRADPDQDLYARLAAVGVVVTPATIRPGTPVREPLRIPGVALSETVLRMRAEDEERSDA